LDEDEDEEVDEFDVDEFDEKFERDGSATGVVAEATTLTSSGADGTATPWVS
jgi:hypothetical protein